MRGTYLLSLIALVLVLPLSGLQAQVLFVNDNDNITFNTDTVLNDLAGTGIAFDTYDIPTMGVPPDASVLGNYPVIIWYCSGDGAGLGFWEPGVQADLVDHTLAGNTLWVIGTDVLYAQYGGAPVSFTSGDFALDAMGLASYDVQSYGDDANTGCAQLDVAPGVASQFAPTLLWSFPAIWWADGCTPALDAEAIYTMGPSSYVLFGAQAMIHYHPAGTNVMSTFFDPALIDTYANRVLFLTQTLNYLGIAANVAEQNNTGALQLHLLPADNGGVVLSCTGNIRQVEVRSSNGQLLRSAMAMGARSVELPGNDLCSGLHLVTVTTTSGQRISRKWALR
jgi:hypothetical protein